MHAGRGDADAGPVRARGPSPSRTLKSRALTVAGLKGVPNLADYCASKWGVIGFAKSLANELARSMIRVNVIAPGTVATDMVLNDGLYRLFRPDLDHPTQDDAAAIFSEQINAMSLPWIEPVDVSNAVLYLASDEARYVTGTVLNVDLGSATR